MDTDGSLKPIKAGQIMLSIETHPTKNLDVYSYVGAEYADRTSFMNAAGKGVGYGSPLNVNTTCQTELAPTNPTTPNSGACNADTRALWQANLGFWYRFYKGAAGTVQWGLQYSYTSKNTWSGVGGAAAGDRQHALLLVPLRPAVSRCAARRWSLLEATPSARRVVSGGLLVT